MQPTPSDREKAHLAALAEKENFSSREWKLVLVVVALFAALFWFLAGANILRLQRLARAESLTLPQAHYLLYVNERPLNRSEVILVQLFGRTYGAVSGAVAFSLTFLLLLGINRHLVLQSRLRREMSSQLESKSNITDGMERPSGAT